ncbi:hypothetical protein EDB89DRAFT_1992582 [Lactarius sanguifluus]|nr:hypothetical protein EDB89DRAFT_1992582 [Lactarius sanguifluus]
MRPLSCATVFLATPCYLREPAHARVTAITHTQFTPTIHPKEAFANQTYRGKVVLIAGASQETAITYANAGAKVTLVGRSQEALDESAAAMRAAVSEAQVLAVPADGKIS